MSKALVIVTWDNAPHLSEKAKAELLSSYRASEIEARTQGNPTLGSGAIYPINDKEIQVDAYLIPSHYKRLCAIDFGVRNPALVWLAYNDEDDSGVIYDCWKGNGTDVYSFGQIADIAKSRGAWIPMAWPHDGRIEVSDENGDRPDGAAGVSKANLMREKGVNMLPEHAQHAEPGIGEGTRKALESVSGGLDSVYEAMLQGRFKVFTHLTQWFAEKNFYHRKDGRIVKKRDHLMDASRYLWISRRFAQLAPNQTTGRRERASWKTV